MTSQTRNCTEHSLHFFVVLSIDPDRERIYMSEQEDVTNNPKAQAKADKAYAKASRPWFKKKRFWAIGVILIAVIAQSAGGGGGSESSSSSENTESSEMEAPVEAVAVSAEQLLSDLEANALSAKNAWDKKVVTITGKLNNIDASGDYFSLRGDNEYSFINVQVYIDDSFIETVSAFTNGQTVTVTGEISDVGELLGYSVQAISIP
jgi:ribosomal protein S1